MARRAVLPVLGLTLAACSTSPARVDPCDYGSIRYRLLEEAGPERHPVPADGFHYVDPDSRLVVDIEPARPDAQAEPRVAWKALNGLLTELEALARERNELLASSAAPEVRKRERQAFNGKVSTFFLETFDAALHELEPLASEEAEEERFDRIFTGRFRPGLDPSKTYVNVAIWLRERLEQEGAEAARIAARGEEEEISVVAFHRSAGKNWTRLPVYNYDEIASTGSGEKENSIFSLSEADRARLASELTQAGRAKAALANIRGQIDRLESWRDGVVAEIRGTLNELSDRLSQGPDGWADLLERSASRSEALDLAAGSEALEKRAEAVSALRALAADFGELARFAETVRKVAGAIAAGGDASIAETLLGAGGLVQGIQDLVQTAQGIRSRAAGWDEGVRSIGAFLDALEPGARVGLLPDSLREPLAGASAAVLDVLGRLHETAESIGFDLGGREAVDGLALLSEAEVGGDVVFHLASSAPDGIIRLDDADVSEGDDVLVQIVARPKGSPAARRIVAQYHLEARQLGPHPRLGADAILARASTGQGDATEWKPNVAVTWTLHHRFRDPNTRGRIFNWIHPGVGLHAASLDQDVDSVEFGLGASVTLFDGLLTGGVGINLNREEDRGYFLVGTSLFRLLGQLTATGQDSGGN